MPANLENSATATGLEKVSFHSNPKERQCQRMLKLLLRTENVLGMLKHNCTHLTCQQSNARDSPSQEVNCELADVQAGFRKGRGTRDQIVSICWIIEKARKFQINIYFCFIDYAKAFDCMDCNKSWKFLKRWEYQTILLAT